MIVPYVPALDAGNTPTLFPLIGLQELVIYKAVPRRVGILRVTGDPMSVQGWDLTQGCHWGGSLGGLKRRQVRL